MAQVNRATLKTYFETGDKPTQGQFENLIDSVPNLVDDGVPSTTRFFEYANVQPIDNTPQQLGSTYVLPAATLAAAGNAMLISAWGLITSNVNIKRVGIVFDAQPQMIDLAGDQLNLGAWQMHAFIQRITANSQILNLMVNFSRQTLNAGIPRPGVHAPGFAANLANPLDVGIWVEAPTLNTDITLHGWTVQILK